MSKLFDWALFISLVIATCLTAPLLAASRSGPKPPASKPAAPVPIIIVTKNDNTTVQGRLLVIDPDFVGIQPTAPASAPTTDVPWSDIKRVSNGLTQAKAKETWKEANKDRLCPDCKGERIVTCPTCKGTGKDLSARKDCPNCHGAGMVTCTAKDCDKGQIPCPGPCLKLSVGKWVDRGGLKWRDFPADGGTFTISERHLGSVVEMKNGKATGNLIECPVCHGRRTVDCPVCLGAGKVACTTCRKSDAPGCPDHCDDGKAKCKTCGGTGLRKDAALLILPNLLDVEIARLRVVSDQRAGGLLGRDEEGFGQAAADALRLE